MAPIGQRYCEVCAVYITRKNFCQHLKTRRHMEMEASKKSQPLTEEKEIQGTQEVPEKKRKILKKKKINEEKEMKFCDAAQAKMIDEVFQKAFRDELPNFYAEDVLHYVSELARPLNDPTPPCTCSKCQEGSKILGLPPPGTILNYTNDETNIPKQNESGKTANTKCIDLNRVYDNLVVFPSVNMAEEKKTHVWKSISEFAQKIDENKVKIADNGDSKQNLSSSNFSVSSAPSSSSHPSIEFVRQHETHHCCKFGEELPEYLKFSHCHEKMFHFFGVKDERTDSNLLFVVMK